MHDTTSHYDGPRSGESMLEIMSLADKAKVCGDLEEMARTYWERSWALGEPPDMVAWYQRHSAKFYAEARRVRAHAIAHPEPSRLG